MKSNAEKLLDLLAKLAESEAAGTDGINDAYQLAGIVCCGLDASQRLIAALEAQAAIGRRAVEALRAIEWSRPVLNRYGFWAQGCIECERGRESGHTEKCATAAIMAPILRDSEQAGMGAGL